MFSLSKCISKVILVIIKMYDILFKDIVQLFNSISGQFQSLKQK